MSGPKAASKAAGGGIAISASDMKLISTVKEVVANNTDEEIYAMLKECNRDPNEAATRLMNEEKFHVVKHKKDKKKEAGSSKDSSDNRQGSTGTSGRSGRTLGGSGIRSYGRGASSFRSYTNEGSGGRGKTVTAEAVKEIGNSFSKAPSTTSGGDQSYSLPVQPKTSYANTINNVLPPSSGVPNGELSQGPPPFNVEGDWPAAAGFGTVTNLQGAWLAGAGRSTIAEMLKGGGQKSNPCTNMLANGGVVLNVVASTTSSEQLSSMQVHAVMEPMASLSLDTHAQSSDNVAGQESETTVAPGLQADIVSYGVQDTTSNQYVNNDGASIVERGISSASMLHTDSNVSMPWEENVRTSSGFPSGQNFLEEPAGLEEGQEGQFSAYEVQHYSEIQQERADVDWSHEAPPIVGTRGGTAVEAAPTSPRSPCTTSAVLAPTASMQDHNSVIIPDHIKLPAADCTMLSFGSFGAGFEGLASNPKFVADLENQSEVVSDLVPLSPSVKTSAILDHDQKSSVAHVQNLDSSENISPAEKEGGIKEEAHLEQPSAQHEYPPSYSVLNSASIDNTTHYAAVAETESRAHEVNPVLVPYDDSTYYNGAMIRSSMPERHSSPQLASSGKLGASRTADSIGQNASQEVINATAFQNSNPPGGLTMPYVNTGPAGTTVPQHSVHPYGTQPSGLPFGPFANTPSYPYMSPGFSHVQTPYQHNYGGSGNYHQVPAAVGAGGMKYTPPQYKTSGPVASGIHNAVSSSSLGYGASVSSSSLGYGAYLNTQPASNLAVTGTNTSSLENAAPQLYKDNMYLSNNQLDGTSMWLQNQLARETQASSYYNIPSQSQPMRYSQTQLMQTHAHPGTVYGNMYHPQHLQLSPAQQLLQQQQALASMGGLGTQPGSFQQNQRAQSSWPPSGGF